MKKLSIEEKAKAYDESIKRLEDIKTGKCQKTFVFTEGLFDYIFPELKEGDGEKWIPKEIAKYLKEKGDFRSCWLAWLEKQCEQKLYVNDNAKEMFIKALERVEEQNKKGYKLTDCDKNSWWEDFKAYTSCIIEQKPADTENGAKWNDSEIPNSAWSEADETMWAEISDLLWEGYKQSCSKFYWDDIRNWVNHKLKSLRHQNTWKPSDEHIEALKQAKTDACGKPYFNALVSLYINLIYINLKGY